MTTPSRLRCFRRLVFRLSTRRRMAFAPSLIRSLPDRRNREISAASDASAATAAVCSCSANCSCGIVLLPNLPPQPCCDGWRSWFCCCWFPDRWCSTGDDGCSCCCSIIAVLTMSSTRDHLLDSLWNVQFSLSAHSPSESESSPCEHTTRCCSLIQ
jgi:hypothetical protein